ncbi:glycosyltransferase [Thermodesulfobacteriota bacterium]
MKDRLDVLMVQAAAIEGYPPTINQANIMAEAGIKVGVLCMWHPELEDKNLLNPSIKRWVGARQWLSFKEPLSPVWIRFFRQKAFARKLAWIRKRFRPQIEIGYDNIGCRYLGPPERNKSKTIWHLHEHPDPKLAVSRGVCLAQDFIKRHADSADLIVVPDYGRARAMLNSGIVKKLPTVVMNCPRRLENIPANALQAAIGQFGFNNQSIVLYQGAVSDVQCSDITVKSMWLWPKSSLLVFIGPVKEIWKQKIMTIASTVDKKLVDRIVFMPPVKYTELFSYTVGASLGIGLIRPQGEHYTYCSGASNKRFEYMACKIPQVANSGPGMDQIIEKTGAGICVNPESPEAVGEAISDLLKNKDKRIQMGKNGRQAHLEKFNYEVQFEPVLQHIKRFLKNQTVRSP